ncbi:MAG: hypothetical protein DRH56_06565 [Deltaproteobacteria bacterium]|nr:MAG: hypothetical protein DRH56_06565 [Deltaproteobacteria bacterium]
MTIREQIKTFSLALAGDIFVKDVRIGLGYTAVLLEDGRAGVAYTFHKDAAAGCTVFKGIRPLAGKRAADLLAMLDAEDPVESAVALATSNALTNIFEKDLLEGDALEHVEIRPDDHVGMVGYFAPLIPVLRKRAASLRIFEQSPRPGGEVLPQEVIRRELARCQVALVTSTAILNHTVDALLSSVADCREVLMLGASTPMAREMFRDTPVTALSGVIVTEPAAILRIVSEGGGMRLFKRHIRKVSRRLAR